MIETLREIITESPSFYVGWGGLLIGLVFGFVVFRTNFCTMGSISDMLSFGDFRRFRSWLFAIAIAILGVGFMQNLGIVETANSIYLMPMLGWGGAIVGGLMFGIGMVYAGGCLSKNLVRAGSGDLRSLMVLIVTGLFGFMTISGLLALARLSIFSPLSINLSESGLETQSIAELLASITGGSQATLSLVVILVFSLGLLTFCLKDKSFRSSPIHLIAGIGIGACVIAGWALTGLAYDDFADVPIAPISLSFVRPTGETLEYMMRSTALGAPGFGIVTLLGTLLGSFLGSITSKKFHLATFANVPDTLSNMGGAALMGIGGVLALGCTVGQGLSGISTLAIGSLIAFIAIVIGGIIGIKLMEHFA